jgi:hypothetical protein
MMKLEELSYDELKVLGQQKLDEFGDVLKAMDVAIHREAEAEKAAKTRLNAGLLPL